MPGAGSSKSTMHITALFLICPHGEGFVPDPVNVLLHALGRTGIVLALQEI